MPQKTKGADGYKRFSDSLAAGQIGNFYIFHGDERYLLERSLAGIREKLCPGGLNSFNYRRFEGKCMSADELESAINTLPFFADRTLIEVDDFDIFKQEETEKRKLAGLLSDLPDYVCVVIIFDTIKYKPDGRIKLDASIKESADVVEFAVQGQDRLSNWIKRHFTDVGKRISSADAEYLVFITGGLMSTLHGEIEKTAAYAKGETVTRADIDAVVLPELETYAYKLSDALARRDYTEAMRILDELFQMREAPHKIMFNISLKMRQLLAARVCIDNSLQKDALMRMCGIRYEFQAKALIETARRLKLSECCNAVIICSDTAYRLNSSPDPNAGMIELISKLSLNRA